LPSVTLDANYSLNGAGTHSANSFNKVKSGDFASWDAGLSVSYPWDKRADQASYQSTVNALKQEELRVRDLRLTIVKEVRSAVRVIQTSIKRVEVAKIAYDLQKKNLEAEEKKYSLGLSTSFEVLSFQEDLASAAVSRISAVVDYHRSVVRLWNTIGITLQKNGILFEKPNP
jgi:outer membrane protein TolC